MISWILALRAPWIELPKIFMYRSANHVWRTIHEASAQLLLFGASALVTLGATHYVCPRQTAEEQSAAFALISELLDANALDYHAAGNSLRVLTLASNIFSMKMTQSSVGFATHNQEKRVCKLACERVSADCSASVLLRKTRRIARPKYRSASKEYNVRDCTDELAVLDYWRAWHECGQVGTTKFNGNFIKFIILGWQYPKIRV